VYIFTDIMYQLTVLAAPAQSAWSRSSSDEQGSLGYGTVAIAITCGTFVAWSLGGKPVTAESRH
jgi:hypothetical protein